MVFEQLTEQLLAVDMRIQNMLSCSGIEVLALTLQNSTFALVRLFVSPPAAVDRMYDAMRLRWGNKKSTRKYAWNTRKRKIEPV